MKKMYSIVPLIERLNSVSILAVFVIVSSCFNRTGTPNYNFDHLSNSQDQLVKFTDLLKSIYYSKSSDSAKNATIGQFPEILNTYLSRNRLDSIHAHVDEVKIVGRTISTILHYRDIQFKYQLGFLDSLPATADSVFKFAKGLRGGSDTTVSFTYMGSCEVNNPESKNTYAFRIFAFPIPLSFSRR